MNRTQAPVAFLFLLLSLWMAGPTTAFSADLPRPNQAKAPEPAEKVRLVENYGRVGLGFEANQGQTDPRVRFLARGGGYTIFLTGTEAVLALREQRPSDPRMGLLPARFHKPESLVRQAWQDLIPPRLRDLVAPSLSALFPALSANPEPRIPNPENAVLRMKLVGGNGEAHVVGFDELPGRSNYFIGNDPKKWRTNVPNYAKVKYESVYPGVDLVYYGNQRQLEYDFVVAPGADPNQIKLSFAGADDMRVDPASGDLVVKLGKEEVRFQKPVAYQPTVAAVSGLDPRHSSLVTRHLLDGTFILASNNEAAFRVAGYDPKRALVIDPGLVYSTYLGGSGDEAGYRIAVDSARNAYVTGETSSTDFPTANPLQPKCGGGCANFQADAFVSKLNPDGSKLVYSTYLGGSGIEYGTAIALDSFDNAYVTGLTTSTNFPTVNPLQPNNRGGCDGFGTCGDAFVAKLNSTGSALVYSTYLGGNGGDWGNGIAVDAAGNAYLTGLTGSTDFPTVNAIQPTYGGGPNRGDAFVAKLNPAGSALVYSTYLGGSSDEWGIAVAVDTAGNAYVTGWTDSGDFPTVNPLQANNRGGCDHYGNCGDAFVAKLNPAGSALVYSTYLGGSEYDEGDAIAADAAGNAYLTGRTGSTDFPTANPLQANCRGGGGGPYYPCLDAFVTKLNPAGSALVYSTYLGGSDADHGYGIAVDAARNAVDALEPNVYITGTTWSSDFPTANPLQANCGGGLSHPCYDAFVAKLSPAGSALVFSTYLGGSGDDGGEGIALDSCGNNVYVTGGTTSTDFPTTANALQPNYGGGGSDAFVVKIPADGGAPVVLSPASSNFGYQAENTTSAARTVTLTNKQDSALNISTITTSGDFAVSTNTCGSSVPAKGKCTISVTFTPKILGKETGTLTVTDDAPNSLQRASLVGKGVLPVALSPASLNFGYQPENITTAPKAVTLTNNLSTTLTISSIGTSGDFAETNTCGGSVPAKGKCTVSVTFTPTILGNETGTLTVTDDAPNSPQTASLSGKGIVQATVSPTSLTFSGQKVATTSAGKDVTLTSNLSTALTISSITFTGADPGDFAQTNTCGGSLAAKSNCTISVTFTPAATGKRTATMNVNDGANNSPQTSSLTGTGK